MALLRRTLLLAVLALALAFGLSLTLGSTGMGVSHASAHQMSSVVQAQGLHPQTADGFDCDNYIKPPICQCHFFCPTPPVPPPTPPPSCFGIWSCYNTAPLGPCGGFSGQGKCGGYGCPTIYITLGGGCPLGKAPSPTLALVRTGSA